MIFSLIYYLNGLFEQKFSCYTLTCLTMAVVSFKLFSWLKYATTQPQEKSNTSFCHPQHGTETISGSCSEIFLACFFSNLQHCVYRTITCSQYIIVEITFNELFFNFQLFFSYSQPSRVSFTTGGKITDVSVLYASPQKTENVLIDL